MESVHIGDPSQEPGAVTGRRPGAPGRALGNQRGLALVLTLMFTLVALAIVASLFYLVLQQTRSSAAHKRYRNSLEAAHGGAQLITKELIPQLFKGGSDPRGTLSAQFTSIGLELSSNACLNQKLTSVTSGWTACGPQARSLDPRVDWDMTFKLQGTRGGGFDVFAKIVDTQPGNSDSSGVELLESGSGVTGSNAGVNAMHLPATYRIETEGRTRNGQERVALTIFYSY